ncbi:MAG TPA: hypothetical protein VGR89_12680, partial [Puia sp.]|nr:hypothetical protein [Puia sp.]
MQRRAEGNAGRRIGRRGRAWRIGSLIAGTLLLFVAGFFMANALVCRKVADALRELPASMTVHYRSLRANVLTGSIQLGSIYGTYAPAPGHSHSVSVDHMAIKGFSMIAWLTSRRMRIREIDVEGLAADLDQEFSGNDSATKQISLPTIDGRVGRIVLSGLRVRGTHRGRQIFSLEGDVQLDSVTRDTMRDLHIMLRQASYD